MNLHCKKLSQLLDLLNLLSRYRVHSSVDQTKNLYQNTSAVYVHFCPVCEHSVYNIKRKKDRVRNGKEKERQNT